MHEIKHPGAVPAERRGRPVGVVLIAIVCFVFVIALAGLVVRALVGTDADAALSLPRLLLALALIPICALGGAGLLQRRNWARWLVVGGLLVAIVGLLVRGLGMESLDYGLRNAFTGSLLPIAIMLYLLHPSIRPWFDR